MPTKRLQPTSLPAPSSGTLFAGLTSLWRSRSKEEWNHWVFMQLNDYEVHVAGPGVPVTPRAMEEWTPRLEEIATMTFRPCPMVGLDTPAGITNAETRRVTQGISTLVGKLGPVLYSDQFRLVSDADDPDPTFLRELHAKRLVAEKVIRDYEITERIYRRALEEEPDNPDFLGDFALFLQEKRGDDDQAENFWRRAIAADPEHARNLGNFAVFQHEVRGNDDMAEQLYLRAIAADPHEALHASNFALFLHEVRGEDDVAEEFHERALRLNGDDPSVLANFALFLHNTRRDDDRAEELYRRAMLADGEDANCLGNFALFMKNVRHDYDVAEKYFQLALQVNPRHAGHLGNFAIFMKHIRHDYAAAEELYHRALRADPSDPHRLGSLASFTHQTRRNQTSLTDELLHGMEMDPGNASRLGNFVQLLLAQGRIKEGMPLLDKVLEMHAPNPTLNLELWFYALAHDPERFDEALGRIKGYLLAGTRSRWNLRANAHRARLSGHPQPDLLDTVANVIAGQKEMTELDEFASWNLTDPIEPEEESGA
ncbi:MAG: hypothetical protein HQL96_02675 [Magnetococcales bacterium]|nr:hypothetical protein [Magnetococcales bacterium]